MTKYHDRSQRNITGATQTRLKPGARFLNLAGVKLGKSCGAKAQPLASTLPHFPRVAYFAMTEPCPLNDCRIRIGWHRCADADLVVLPDLALLHDRGRLAANVDLAVSFLYIVSLGVTVFTKTQLATASGVPGNLHLQHCVRHVPAAENVASFCIDRRLRVEQEDVLNALRRIARLHNTKITFSKTSAPREGDIPHCDLGGVVGWAISARMVQNE